MAKKEKRECQLADCRYTRKMERAHRRNVERLAEALTDKCECEGDLVGEDYKLVKCEDCKKREEEE